MDYNYTVTTISEATPDQIEKLIVAYVPNLPKKLKTSIFYTYRKPQFTKHLSDCWFVISIFNKSEDKLLKRAFEGYIDNFYPLGAPTESEACYKICQAALVALITQRMADNLP